LPTAFDEVEGGVDELRVEGFRDGGKAGVGGIVVLVVVVPVAMMVGVRVVVMFRGGRWTGPLRNGSSRGLVLGGGMVEEGGQGGLTCGWRAFLSVLPVRVLLLLLAVAVRMCPLDFLLFLLLLLLVAVVVVVVVVAVGAVADGTVPGHDLVRLCVKVGGWGG
jgi:hypothetical protein